MVEETVAATRFTLSSVLALLGAAFVLLGSAGAFYFGRIRDHYTDERISENVRKTAEAEAAGNRAIAEAAKLRESNTLLQLDLEKERVQRLLLEKKVEPRRLSNDQRTLLISKIRSCGWKKAEVIWHGVGEPEFYAKDLASVFEQAGVPTHVHTLGPFMPSAWGLIVIKTANGDSTRLKNILDEAGVASDTALTNSTLGEKDHPTLIVGTRGDVGVPHN
jgi:hypothetical protein